MEQIALLDKILTQVKQKEGKSYISFSALLTKLGKTGRTLLGLTEAKPTGAALEKALQPYLGNAFTVLKGSRTSFLAFKIPLDEIVGEAMRLKFQKGPFSPNQLAPNMPMKKDEFVASFNRLLESGRIAVSVNNEFKVTVRKVGDTGSIRPTPLPPTPLAPPTTLPQDDRKLFREAFDQLDGGRIFVRICNLRRKLAWNEEHFNSLLRKLRAEGVIQLHAGDVSSMSEEDITQSFTDENNFFYATLTMKPLTDNQ